MKNKLHTSYDEITDVLYIRVGSNVKTENEEEENGLILRYHEKTHKPVGATLVDYKEYWKPKRKRLAARMSEFFGITKIQAEKVLETIR